MPLQDAPSLPWMAVASGRPFVAVGLDDDQADAMLSELLDACELLGVVFEVHLIDDMQDGGDWTLIAHPSGIHHFGACALDDGAFS